MIISKSSMVKCENRYIILSVASGVMLSLPWLLCDLGWVLLFALVPLLNIRQEECIVGKHHDYSLFKYYFTSFLIWNLLSCWWISYVSDWGMILIVTINALLMATVWWSGIEVSKTLSDRSGRLVLLCFWLTFEYFHHHWTMQWPWLTLGNGLANLVRIIQWYEYTGVLGGSTWILIGNYFVYRLLKFAFACDYLRAFRLLFWTLIIFGIPIAFSQVIYSRESEDPSDFEVIVIQPNINPYTEKFAGLSDMEQLQRIADLAASEITFSTKLLVAPETSLPGFWEDSVSDENPIVFIFSPLMEKYPDVVLLGGCMTSRKIKQDEEIPYTAKWDATGKCHYETYNSALFMNNRMSRISHKRILVSGVERTPFQEYFPWLSRLTIDIGGFSNGLAAGKTATVFKSESNAYLGPVICFESVFGNHCNDLVFHWAESLVVITNDCWWKDSPGIWQHFAFSKIRAIETRRSIVRSANTGISGIINQRGDVVNKTEINSCQVLKSSIHLNSEITFYVRHGDYIGIFSVVFSSLILIYIYAKKQDLF